MTTAVKKIVSVAAVALCLLAAGCRPSATGQDPFQPTSSNGPSTGSNR